MVGNALPDGIDKRFFTWNIREYQPIVMNRYARFVPSAPVLFDQMNRELDRMQGDIDWMIEKFDYVNKDKDWKNSKDAVQRTMQKIVGGYPADPVFRDKK